eukprot:2569678-Rhodomonas_salina.1
MPFPPRPTLAGAATSQRLRPWRMLKLTERKDAGGRSRWVQSRVSWGLARREETCLDAAPLAEITHQAPSFLSNLLQEFGFFCPVQKSFCMGSL